MRVTFEQAYNLLSKGRVVAVPTETVYGLAAPLENIDAIKQIFTLKKRPAKNPLIIHIPNESDACFCTEHLPEDFFKLTQAFWPGPLTLILPAKVSLVPDIVRAGLQTAAFRMPAHPLIQELLKITGPLVMPSANLSGGPSATSPEHVEKDFGSSFPILDGGTCLCGVESTILIFQNERWNIARLGALPSEAFVDVLGYQPEIASNEPQETPICPGQLFRHYAPKAKLILNDSEIERIENIVGFIDRKYPSSSRLFSLGPSNDPEKVAEQLYSTLRSLDEAAVDHAWVDMDFPKAGLWITIAERLCRASKQD